MANERSSSPLHEGDVQRFTTPDYSLLAIDPIALTILLVGFYLFLRRKPLGWLITAVSGLLPVLHIIPVAFDGSLYHERYAMTATAILGVLLPKVIDRDFCSAPTTLSRASLITSLVATGWLVLAVINIRITLPLWSDETKLWLWVLREHPDSVTAKDHLLSTYIENHDSRARKLADSLVAENAPCPNCMVNAASLAAAQLAILAAWNRPSKKAGNMPTLRNQPRQLQGFILATGQLRELQGNPAGAEEAYRDAITMEPLDPGAQMTLALICAPGRVAEAVEAEQRALSLFAPDERNRRRQEFEHTLAEAKKARPSADTPSRQ